MVFRQVGSDTDNLIAKFGLLNKSFAEIKVDLINKQGWRSFGNFVSKKDVDNFSKFQQELKNGTSYHKAFNSNLSTSHTYIQKQAVELRKLYTEQNLLHRQLRTNKISQEQYNTAMEANKAQIKQITTGTQKLTLAQKASAVASKAAGIALNLAMNVGLSLAINLIIAGITKLVNREKELREASESLVSTFKTLSNEVSQLSSNADELIPEYEKLSRGVNKLGENVSLTTEEYERYQEVVNQIADDVPTVISGYDAEGNAIINLKNNVDELKQAYIEARKEKYRLALSENDDTADDAVKNFHDLSNQSFGELFLNQWGKGFAGMLLSHNQGDAGDFISETQAIETLDKVLTLSYEDAIKLVSAFNTELNEYEKGYLKSLGLTINTTPEEFKELRNVFKTELTGLKSEVSTGLQSVRNVAQMWLFSSDDYDYLTEDMQNLASIIINNLPNEIGKEFESKKEVGVWVNKLIETLNSATPEVQSAFDSLMNLDTSNLDAETAQAEIDKYLDIIINELSDELSIDKNQLKLILGLDEKSVGNTVDTVKQDVIPSITDLTTAYNTFNEKIKETIDLQNKLADVFQKVANGEKFSASEVYDLISEIPELANYLKTFDDGGFTFSADGISLISDNLTQKEKDNIQSKIDEAQQIIDNYNSVKTRMENAGSHSYESSLKIELSGLEGDKADAEKLIDAYTVLQNLLDGMFDEHQMTLDGIDEKYNTAKSSIDSYNDSIKTIDSAIDKLNEGQALTHDEMIELVEISPKLSDSIEERSNGYYIEVDALKDLRFESKEARNQFIDDQIEMAKQAIESAEAIITAYSLIINSNVDWENNKKAIQEQWEIIRGYKENIAIWEKEKENNNNKNGNDSSTDQNITAFEKELKYLDYLRDMGMISAKEYYKQLYFLNEKYYSDNADYLEQYRDNEVKIRDGITDIEIRAIDRQIEALETLKEKREEEKELQELQIELEEKKLELLNKQSQKNVRYYDAEKREWIWTHNRNDVADAQKAVDEAQEALDEHLYQSNEDKKIEQLEQIKEILQGNEDNPNNPVQFVGSEGVTTLATGRSVTLEEFAKYLGATQPIDTAKFWNAIYSTGLQPNVQKIAESTHNQNYQNIKNSSSQTNTFNVTINASGLSKEEATDAFYDAMADLMTQVDMRIK